MAGQLGKAIYRTSAWQGLRAACKAAAGGLCAECRGYGFECHHLVPIHLGGPALPELSGVEWLCRTCHFRKHGSPRRAGWDALLTQLREGHDGTEPVDTGGA